MADSQKRTGSRTRRGTGGEQEGAADDALTERKIHAFIVGHSQTSHQSESLDHFGQSESLTT